MKCNEFEDNIATYIDDFLDDDLRSEMDEHRAACPACARLAKAHSFIMKSLDNTEPVKAPAGLADSILSRIGAEEQSAVFDSASAEAAVTERLTIPEFDCGLFEEHIAAYVEGNLGNKLRAAMHEHRAACNTCDRKAHTHEIVLSSLKSTEFIEAPAGLYDRILTAVSLYEFESSKMFGLIPKSWTAAVFVASSGLFLAVFIPLWRMVMNHIPDVDFTGAANLINGIKTQISLLPLQAQSLLPEAKYLTQIQHAISVIIEPVQIPLLSFSIPPYYFIAIAVMSSIAWYYMSDSGDYGYSAASHIT